MASIIKTSINLNNIPKDKIIVGAKGKYLPISLTLNDEVDPIPLEETPSLTPSPMRDFAMLPIGVERIFALPIKFVPLSLSETIL